MKKLVINTDGGSRGNPGPAAVGVVFSTEDGEVIANYKECIGEATNNIAEYKIECRLDSELVVKQLTGHYKVKDPKMKELNAEVQKLIFFKPIKFVHVRREYNKLADALVNEALDAE